LNLKEFPCACFYAIDDALFKKNGGFALERPLGNLPALRDQHIDLLDDGDRRKTQGHIGLNNANSSIYNC